MFTFYLLYVHDMGSIHMLFLHYEIFVQKNEWRCCFILSILMLSGKQVCCVVSYATVGGGNDIIDIR